MGRHESRIGQRSRMPRDRRTVPEERNGPANDAPVRSSIDRSAAGSIVTTFLISAEPVDDRFDDRADPRIAIESQLTSSSSFRVFLLLLLLFSFVISAWDSVCRGWTTDSSPPRFVCTLPSSSVALPPLWPRLHDYALAFLGPGIVLLVGRVYQWVIPLVLFHVLPHPAEKKNKRVKPYASQCSLA